MSQDHHSSAAAAEVDLFPAGASYSHGHHGHTIVSKRVLLLVLGLLLFCTALTVGAAQLEDVIAHAFHIEIPQWVNVFVALSIGVFKSIIVVMFFMQLRYDNPMNSVIAIFTLFIVAFFLGFTMIDLGNRGAIFAYKAQAIQPGGTGGKLDEITVTGSIATFARTRADEEIARLKAEGKPLPEFLAHYAHAKAEGLLSVPAGEEEESKFSNADQSRPLKGITLPELLPAGSKPKEGHGGEPKPEGKPEPKAEAGHAAK